MLNSEVYCTVIFSIKIWKSEWFSRKTAISKIFLTAFSSLTIGSAARIPVFRANNT